MENAGDHVQKKYAHSTGYKYLCCTTNNTSTGDGQNPGNGSPLNATNNCTGYFLDHRLLLKNAFTQANPASHNVYKLRSDIFIYTEKETQRDSDKRKRKKPKRPAESNQATQSYFTDLQSINSKAEGLIKECQQYITPLKYSCTKNIQSILEDQNVFPTLRGVNSLDQHIVTKVSSRKFLIPSKCIFFNDDIRNLSNILSNQEKFDLIILDPPWRNKYIRRLKVARAELSYKMMDNEELSEISLGDYIHENTLVVIWCTNSNLHHKAVMETFLPKWNLKFLAKWYWMKLNHKGELVCPFKDTDQKQPFEHLFLATHRNNTRFNFKEEFLISVASTIHSHKPPLFEIFKKHLPEQPKCLELFARYLYPGFTCIGLEVLKLQDIRLYELQEKKENQQ